MRVRRAFRKDLLAIGRIADAAHWESYRTLLGLDTIEALVQRDYSPASIARRILKGGVLIAETEEDLIVGFADAEIAEDHIRLTAISTDPAARRRGVATTLLTALHRLAPGLPICADVLLGDEGGERFYETLGFSPGEVVADRVGAEDLLARRWWRPPEAGLGSLVS